MELKQPFVIASNNHFKTVELIQCFNFCGYQAISYLDLIAKVEFPNEGTDDYGNNALVKARFIAKLLPNELVVADDSGMILEAYPDQFGVTTARELSEYRDLDQLNRHIIKLVDGKSRGVKMLSYLAMVGLAEEYIGVGQFNGEIAFNEAGNNGSSFDLILKDLNSGKTLAELPDSQKLRLLHRTKAIQNLIEKIGVA